MQREGFLTEAEEPRNRVATSVLGDITSDEEDQLLAFLVCLQRQKKYGWQTTVAFRTNSSSPSGPPPTAPCGTAALSASFPRPSTTSWPQPGSKWSRWRSTRAISRNFAARRKMPARRCSRPRRKHGGFSTSGQCGTAPCREG